MARTRRSISIKIEVFWRLRQMTHGEELADAALLEEMINARADAKGIASISRNDALAAFPRRRRKEPEVSITSQHFTF